MVCFPCNSPRELLKCKADVTLCINSPQLLTPQSKGHRFHSGPRRQPGLEVLCPPCPCDRLTSPPTHPLSPTDPGIFYFSNMPGTGPPQGPGTCSCLCLKCSLLNYLLGSLPRGPRPFLRCHLLSFSGHLVSGAAPLTARFLPLLCHVCLLPASHSPTAGHGTYGSCFFLSHLVERSTEGARFFLAVVAVLSPVPCLEQTRQSILMGGMEAEVGGTACQRSHGK